MTSQFVYREVGAQKLWKCGPIDILSKSKTAYRALMIAHVHYIIILIIIIIFIIFDMQSL